MNGKLGSVCSNCGCFCESCECLPALRIYRSVSWSSVEDFSWSPEILFAFWGFVASLFLPQPPNPSSLQFLYAVIILSLYFTFSHPDSACIVSRSSQRDIRGLPQLSGVFPWQRLCALPRATLPVPAEGRDVTPRHLPPRLPRRTLRTEREGHQPLHECVSPAQRPVTEPLTHDSSVFRPKLE